MIRSLVWKYGFSAYSGIVTQARCTFDGFGFGAIISVKIKWASKFSLLTYSVGGLKSVPQEIEGLSLVPQLKDAKAPRSRPAMTSHGPGNDSVRTETHRYIRYADGSEELYDMRKDPHEFKNLASDPKTKKLRKKLASHFPKNPAKPVEGSNSRLIERKKDGSVYWQNTLIEKDAKIPEYE